MPAMPASQAAWFVQSPKSTCRSSEVSLQCTGAPLIRVQWWPDGSPAVENRTQLSSPQPSPVVSRPTHAGPAPLAYPHALNSYLVHGSRSVMAVLSTVTAPDDGIRFGLPSTGPYAFSMFVS